MVDRSQIRAPGGRTYDDPCDGLCGNEDVRAWELVAQPLDEQLRTIAPLLLPEGVVDYPMWDVGSYQTAAEKISEQVEWARDAENRARYEAFVSSKSKKAQLYNEIRAQITEWNTRPEPDVIDQALWNYDAWVKYVNFIARSWIPNAMKVRDRYNDFARSISNQTSGDPVPTVETPGSEDPATEPPGPSMVDKLLQYGLVAGLIYLVAQRADT